MEIVNIAVGIICALVILYLVVKLIKPELFS